MVLLCEYTVFTNTVLKKEEEVLMSEYTLFIHIYCLNTKGFAVRVHCVY